MNSGGESAGAMRAVADRGACCGYGVCAEICPEVFKLDEAGLIYLDDDIVPTDLVERAKEGAEACPQMALQIVPLEG
jgi:ferredoxin